jgi:hypothetical protein
VVNVKRLAKEIAMSSPPTDQDLVWIVQAMVETGHSRDWFNRRIAAGRLRIYHKMGEVKVYISRHELAEAEENKDNKG